MPKIAIYLLAFQQESSDWLEMQCIIFDAVHHKPPSLFLINHNSDFSCPIANLKNVEKNRIYHKKYLHLPVKFF
ncbi:MAG: hypothetical protein ACJA2B_002000 [Candidatus Endobugula sp.]|jgi:hypothetical protein